MANPIRIIPQAQYNEGETSALFFDTVRSFTPSFNKRLTQYAISDKSSITNHVVKTNPTIQMVTRVTASPITAYTNNLVGYDNNSERPKSAEDLLYEWWNQDIDLFIDEGTQSYSSYQLTRLEPIEDGGDSKVFTMTFEKARRVGYQRITIVQTMDADKAETAATTDTGKTNNTSEERVSQISRAIADVDANIRQLLEIPEEPETPPTPQGN